MPKFFAACLSPLSFSYVWRDASVPPSWGSWGWHSCTLEPRRLRSGFVSKIPFYPYFYIKDLFSVILLGIFFSGFVFFAPNILNHPDNYIEANPLVTPPHIVPEWYFLPFYAILRSIPHKAGGIIAMGAAILMLLILPYLNTSEIRCSQFRPIFKQFFWFFIADCLILGWIGGKPVESPYIEIGQIATGYYFAFFFVIIPLLGYVEKYLIYKAKG